MLLKKQEWRERRLTWGPGPGWGLRTHAAPQRPSGSGDEAHPCVSEGEKNETIFTWKPSENPTSPTNFCHEDSFHISLPFFTFICLSLNFPHCIFSLYLLYHHFPLSFYCSQLPRYVHALLSPLCQPWFVSPFSKELSDGCLVESLLLVEKLSDGLSIFLQQPVLHQVTDTLQKKKKPTLFGGSKCIAHAAKCIFEILPSELHVLILTMIIFSWLTVSEIPIP